MHELRKIFSDEHFVATADALELRGFDLQTSDQNTYFQLRDLETQRNALRADKNILSGQFRDADEQTREYLRARLGDVNSSLEDIEESMTTIRPAFTDRMLSMPNVSAPHVPIGKGDSDNIVVSLHGDTAPRFNGPAIDHLTLGTRLGIIDNKAAARLSGTSFSLLRNEGAVLKRALVSFMLDAAAQKGYEEVEVPYLVKPDAMVGTGQLPKFEEDMFMTHDNRGNPLYLIPTTEVPLTNLMSDHVFSEGELPFKLTGYSENFRREAGKAGQDTKGLIRNHQFPKVELVRIDHPDHSWDSFQDMIGEAKGVLDALGLPYRALDLCTGDLGVAALATRDLEVWLPSQNRYLEVSSVSNTGDYQARRMGMKYLDTDTGKREFVHTLNGTAVAVGRTMACILENGQQADGSVVIPEVLHNYTHFSKLSLK